VQFAWDILFQNRKLSHKIVVQLTMLILRNPIVVHLTMLILRNPIREQPLIDLTFVWLIDRIHSIIMQQLRPLVAGQNAIAPSWSRPCHAKAPGASGATATARCGSPAGRAAISSATTARPRAGHAGTCRVTGRSPIAVYVDATDAVWVSDWGANAIVHFDPKTEKFEAFPLPDHYANVR
jgi:hypothetical protein